MLNINNSKYYRVLFKYNIVYNTFDKYVVKLYRIE